MFAYPEAFFQLQVHFAHKIAAVYKIPIEKALFRYTSLYVRSIGYFDQQHPDENNPIWQSIIQNLPQSLEAQTEYFFQKHLEYEKKKLMKTPASNQIMFGCFSYSFNQQKNDFALHFTNNDPEGNLGKSRIEYRQAELKALTESIKEMNKPSATIKTTTWLLSIDAFKRLLPPTFIATPKTKNAGLAQNNAWWGQFVDREGKFREELGEILLANASHYYENIDDYFPLKTLRAESTQEVFFDYYLK